MFSKNFQQAVGTCFGLYMAFAIAVPKNAPAAKVKGDNVSTEEVHAALGQLAQAEAQLAEARKALMFAQSKLDGAAMAHE
mmetsp:Transcript_8690/g.27375  ORF Transcript_8690/g.27375 Transcript_8690/m.27375 type:complete len:80 (-) Transcript_8690:322-561(-)